MNGYDLWLNAHKKMEAKDIDRHATDLYLRVNVISKELIAEYEYKNLVTTFIDNIDGDLWYDVPFCAY